MRKTFLSIIPILLCYITSFAQNATVFHENGKYGIKNSSGTITITPKYDTAYPDTKAPGIIITKTGNKTGFVDKNGNEATPPKYDMVLAFQNSVFVVKLDNKTGVVDANGKEIIPCIYDLLFTTSNTSQYWVKQGNRSFYIDRQGKELTQYTSASGNNTNTNASSSADNGSSELSKGVTEYNNKNFSQAYNWFKQSADKGNDKAMYNLGIAHEYARGTTKNIAQARYWYLKAEEKGNQGASTALARIGRGATNTQISAQSNLAANADDTKGLAAYKAKNYTEAMNWWQKAAEKGSAGAMFSIGAMYGKGEGVEQNYNTALNWYKKAAEKGEASAMLNIGLLYVYGNGVEQSDEEAKKWLQQAANKGNKNASEALQKLASKTLNQGAKEFNKGLTAFNAENYTEAMEWYKKSAEMGHPSAMNNLGSMYMKAQGVKRDDKESFKWLKMAAEKEDTNASGTVGAMYYYGSGTEANAEEAFKWLKKAVDKGNTNTLVMELLALVYEHGIGTVQNYAEAEKWFQKAAIAGSETASASLKNIQANKQRLSSAKATFANSKVPKQLFAFKEEGTYNYGFKDETGKIVIPAGKYSIIETLWTGFQDGMADVIVNGKYGYINTSGKMVIPEKYNRVKHFSEGLAAVLINEKWGYIDKNGKEIVASKYDDANAFRNGMASVKHNGKWGFINKTGKEITQFIYDDGTFFNDEVASVKIDKKYLYIDKNGKEIATPNKYTIAYFFSEGLAQVQNNNRLWGYINNKGLEVIPPIYGSLNSFSDGMAAFQPVYNAQTKHKKGYLDKSGKEIVSPKYDWAEEFSDGMAAVGNGEFRVMRRIGKWGFIDKTGREIVPLKYDNVARFSEGLAAVKLSNKWGFIDKNGIVVIPLQYTSRFYMYDDLTPIFRNGVAEVIKDGKKVMIDKTGRTVVVIGTETKSSTTTTEQNTTTNTVGNNTKTANSNSTTLQNSTLRSFKSQNGKYGYKDQNGKEIIAPKYEVAGHFPAAGLASVKLNSKWGFIDKTGKEVIAPQYRDANNFSEGLASVATGWPQKWGFIDQNGKQVIPFKYDRVNHIGFKDGAAVVGNSAGINSANYKYGFIDKTGKEIVALKYNNATQYS